jgi:serine/threonine-protein kinase
MVGRTVSQYQLTQKLGAGGMGEIYLAQDTRLCRQVVIKVLPDSVSADPERRRRFLHEARAASALNHPNIVTMHDVLFDGDTAFMVMEWVNGQTLADRLAAGALPSSDVLDYAIQIADALAAAHDAGIIHRDLKPANVMVTDRGLVKVLDFGLAKRSAFAAAAGDTTTATNTTPLTVEGSILGTVSYMSPEQAEGRTVDARSDIFSFGVMLYEMLTAQRPFTGETTLSVLTAILRDEPRPISASMPAVPLRFAEVVQRCIAKRPDSRWQSMHDLRAALAAHKSDSTTLVLPPKVVARRKLPILPLSLAALLVVGASAAWWFRNRPAPAPVVEAVPSPAPASPDTTLTNDGVLAMLRANVAPATILQQIRASQTRFDLSVPEVIRLTQAGASTEMIETMRDPKRPAAPAQQKAHAPEVVPAPPPATPAAPTPSASATVTVEVPDGLPVKIELAEDVPADAEPGRVLHFTVSKEFRIGDSVILPLHAPVEGEVVDGAKKKLIGGAKLTFRLKSGLARGGAVLQLRAAPSGRDSHRPIENPAAKPPKGMAAAIGAEYIAYTDGAQTVRLPR